MDLAVNPYLDPLKIPDWLIDWLYAKNGAGILYAKDIGNPLPMIHSFSVVQLVLLNVLNAKHK